MAKVKYYYDSENLAYRKIKIKKEINLVLLSSFGGIGLVCLYICDLIKHSILTLERPLVDS
jgi:hypothetical protein